ncbi:hypothetical protein DRJ17_04405 [Candidatus Woesearchaeota archaeon]|nr:MAG: hypothetical protein DRJ17_04405 [Candidatus Woesearchaeota archaeon]
MRKKKVKKIKFSAREYLIVLAMICVIVFGIRLYLAFSTEYFSNEAYFNLRQIEHIRSNGLPLYKDDLSYHERTYFFTPGFHYILAFFSLFMPVSIACKIMPNLFATLLSVIIFFIVVELTKNRKVGLIAAFVVGFIPVLFSKTINSISVYTLALPLMFLSLYFLMLINKDKKYSIHTIITMIVLMVVHPSIFYLIIGLLFYLMFIKQERLAQADSELEVFIFSILLVIWFYELVFKNALLVHGSRIIYKNIPKLLLQNYFAQVNILTLIVFVGFIPFILGLYVMYRYTFKEKKRALYIFIGMGIAIFLLLWLRWIELNLGMMILGVVMVILFSQYTKDLMVSLDKSKVSKIKWLLISGMLLLVILTSVFPSVGLAIVENKKVITNSDVEALKVLKKLSEEPSVTLSTIEESHLISYFANDKSILDTNFLLVKDVDTVYEDIATIYTTPFINRAIELTEKYGVQYIYFSEQAKKNYGIKELKYADEPCVELLYSGNVQIYDVEKCKRKMVIS